MPIVGYIWITLPITPHTKSQISSFVFFSRDSFIINHPTGGNDNLFVYVCLITKQVSCLARYLLIHGICIIFRLWAIVREILRYKFTVFNSGLCHIATVWVLIRHFDGLYYLHIHGYAYLDKCYKNGDSILLLNLDVNLSYELQNPRTEPWFNVHCKPRTIETVRSYRLEYEYVGDHRLSSLVTVVCSGDD